MDTEISKTTIQYHRRLYLDRKMKKSVFLDNAVVVSVDDSERITDLVKEIQQNFIDLKFVAKIKDFASDLEDYQKKAKLEDASISEYNDTKFITKIFSEMIVQNLDFLKHESLYDNWGYYTGGAFILGYEESDSHILNSFLDKVHFSDETLFIDYLCQNLDGFCFIQQREDNGITIVVPFKKFGLLQKAINQFLVQSYIA